MSSVPPPPGGYPPYDPKTQWRIYREQQKAAHRAQRDAWKAQQYAMKANYAGAYGPRVPSLVGPLILIAVGVVWLLIYSGHLNAQRFFGWYGHWWPMLLIAAGLAMLAEWFVDVKRETPVRRGGGFVGVLVLLAVLGVVAAGINHMGGRMVGPWNWGNGDNQDFNFFNMGMPEHNVDQEPITEAVPANAAIEIQNPRGDVSVTVGGGSNVEVRAHQTAYAESDSDAKKIFDAQKAAVKVSGTAVVVQASGNDRGRVNLDVTVPAGAQVTVNAGRGDVTADGMSAGININAQRGNVRLNSIAGATLVHFAKGDLTAHNLQGDVTAEGSCGDVTVTDVKGGVSLSCQYFNDMHMQQISGAIRLRTSRTDVQIAQLPGDLALNDDALSVTQAKGTVHVVTHSRDVDLTEIYGDSFVENSDGSIAIAPAGVFGVEAHNSKGDVSITLPPNASGTVMGHSHNGDIVTDYPLDVSGDQNKTVEGRVGAGTAKIVLSAENGDLRIKRGSAIPAPPPMPMAPAPPPPPPNAKRLKGMATQPVTQ
jgi:DUF4097 and DUF4098 domain-containing protein YvlB